MKQIFIFGLMLLASTNIASAHGFHAEVLEAVEHIEVHAMQIGVSLLAAMSAMAIWYAAYRRGRNVQEKE